MDGSIQMADNINSIDLPREESFYSYILDIFDIIEELPEETISKMSDIKEIIKESYLVVKKIHKNIKIYIIE